MSDELLFRIFSSVIIKFPMVSVREKDKCIQFHKLDTFGFNSKWQFLRKFLRSSTQHEKKETVLASKQTWMYVTKKEKQSCCVCAIKHPASANSNDSAKSLHSGYSFAWTYVWIIIIFILNALCWIKVLHSQIKRNSTKKFINFFFLCSESFTENFVL